MVSDADAAETTSSSRLPPRAIKYLRRFYYVAMVVLALAVIGLIEAPEDELWVYDVNLAIWLVFVADYIIRLALAPSKLRFVRENLLDLLAIIPFELILAHEQFAATRMLRLARLARLIWLLRAGVVLWRVSKHARGILKTNGVGYILIIALALTVMGGISLWAIEPEIGTPLDGVWWGFVTTTTVGYGDIAPKTLGGRVIAVGLMLVGIGCISTLSAGIATYFLGHRAEAPTNPHVAYVTQCLGKWDELGPDERRQLALLLTALAEDDPSPSAPAPIEAAEGAASTGESP